MKFAFAIKTLRAGMRIQTHAARDYFNIPAGRDEDAEQRIERGYVALHRRRELRKAVRTLKAAR